MAAIPREMTERGRRSSSSSRRVNTSVGRGGAGNISSNTPDLDPASLTTPTLKTDIFTTGRGGSGNMAKNSDPEATRRAQDIVAHPRRESSGSAHVGRGGAANVFRLEKSGAGVDESAVEDEEEGLSGGGKGREMGLADRGKEWLSGVVGRK